MQERFTYSSEPHAAPIKRKQKYRTDEIPPPPLPNGINNNNSYNNKGTEGIGNNNYNNGIENGSFNIMNDPRIVRGNTYAAKVLTTSLKQEQQQQQKEKLRKVKQEENKRKILDNIRVSTPPPVEGRCHAFIQTENYLEELTDKPDEADAETQTQPFMDRPVSPLFVRSKTGHDATTQIEIGDLFDFDLEVEPILEVLCGKTIQNSMLELMQEEELEGIRREQEEFEAIRNIELAEVQRLEADARRKLQEKERRVQQEKKRLKERLELEEKIAARAFSNQYLSSLHTGVMEELFEDGYFYDPIKKEIEENVMKEIITGLKNRVQSYDLAQNMLEEILVQAGVKAKDMQKKSEECRKIKREQERREMELLALKKKEEEEAAAAARKAAEEAEAAAENQEVEE